MRNLRYLAVFLLVLLFIKKADANPFVYVCSADSPEVFVIDSATQSVVTTIPVTSQPTIAVSSLDGTIVFIGQTDAQVTVIDCATNSVVSTISLTGTPCALAVSSNALIVSTRDRTVTIFDLTHYATLQVINELSIDSQIAISPDGTKLCISNKGLGTVSVYTRSSTASQFTLATTISNGLYFPTQMAFTSDGTGFYLLDVASNKIHLIDATTYQFSLSIHLADKPLALAVASDGTTLYVTTGDGNYCSCGSRSLTVIHTTPVAISLPIKIGHFPKALAVSSDGKLIYVTDMEGIDIYVIDVLTQTLSTTIDIMHSSGGIAYCEGS